jgi:hypothetical protein
MVQIVTLTGTLTDTGENGVTTVSLGDVVNQLLNEHGLTDTGTTEETNLTTTSVGGKKVNNLDTSDENLSSGGLLSELGSLSVDGGILGGLDGATLVNGVTSDVNDTTKGARADRDGDGSASVTGGSTTSETLGTIHSNGTDDILTQVLSNLENELLAVVLGLNGVENGGKLLTLELHVDDGTDDLVNLSTGSGLSAGEASE